MTADADVSTAGGLEAKAEKIMHERTMMAPQGIHLHNS